MKNKILFYEKYNFSENINSTDSQLVTTKNTLSGYMRFF
jgi:hypothetical protein